MTPTGQNVPVGCVQTSLPVHFLLVRSWYMRSGALWRRHAIRRAA
jgi:hypothetical protein